MTEISVELGRRASAGYVKGRAREMAQERIDRVKSDFRRSSWPYALAGGLLGVAAGKIIADQVKSRRNGHRALPELESESPGIYIEGESFAPVEEQPTRKERARQRIEQGKQEVSSRAQRAKEAIRERIPSAQQVRESAESRPLLWGLAAAGVGFLFGSLLPISRREREVIGSAKEEAKALGERTLEGAKQVGREVQEELTREPGVGTSPSEPSEPPGLH